MIENILLTTVKISTYYQRQFLTSASSFFFTREQRLFLVTSRHVMLDKATNHVPDRIEIELHNDPANLASSIIFSLPLYQNNKPQWRQGKDNAGDIDIAVIEVERASLPEKALFAAFTTDNLPQPTQHPEIGSTLLVVGFPLGFHDSLHHLPVVRHGIIASSYGLRFKGEGYFLTDGRTHRGTSGSPVVMKDQQLADSGHPLPWLLLGVHSARLDVGTRDLNLDEALGLNCVWYADMLLTLTAN